MKLGIPNESNPGEARVGLTPDAVGKLAQRGVVIVVEQQAGIRASFPDNAYRAAGAAIAADPPEAFANVDVVVKVQPPSAAEAIRLQAGAVLMSFLQPHREAQTVRLLAERGVTALSMDLVPRLSRAQEIDALSSQATVAGYKAVLIGAAQLPRFMPMLTTAAGTLPPAESSCSGPGSRAFRPLPRPEDWARS